MAIDPGANRAIKPLTISGEDNADHDLRVAIVASASPLNFVSRSQPSNANIAWPIISEISAGITAGKRYWFFSPDERTRKTRRNVPHQIIGKKGSSRAA